MKSIILSVSPQEALNILNGKQTALLRKRVPKGFVGWCLLKNIKKLGFNGYCRKLENLKSAEWRKA